MATWIWRILCAYLQKLVEDSVSKRLCQVVCTSYIYRLVSTADLIVVVYTSVGVICLCVSSKWIRNSQRMSSNYDETHIPTWDTSGFLWKYNLSPARRGYEKFLTPTPGKDRWGSKLGHMTHFISSFTTSKDAVKSRTQELITSSTHLPLFRLTSQLLRGPPLYNGRHERWPWVTGSISALTMQNIILVVKTGLKANFGHFKKLPRFQEKNQILGKLLVARKIVYDFPGLRKMI